MWAVESKTPLFSIYTHVWMQQAEVPCSAVDQQSLDLNGCCDFIEPEVEHALPNLPVLHHHISVTLGDTCKCCCLQGSLASLGG